MWSPPKLRIVFTQLIEFRAVTSEMAIFKPSDIFDFKIGETLQNFGLTYGDIKVIIIAMLKYG